jgi:hypothetical protein
LLPVMRSVRKTVVRRDGFMFVSKAGQRACSSVFMTCMSTPSTSGATSQDHGSVS